MKATTENKNKEEKISTGYTDRIKEIEGYINLIENSFLFVHKPPNEAK